MGDGLELPFGLAASVWGLNQGRSCWDDAEAPAIGREKVDGRVGRAGAISKRIGSHMALRTEDQRWTTARLAPPSGGGFPMICTVLNWRMLVL